MIDIILNKIKTLELCEPVQLEWMLEKFTPDWELWEHIPRATLIQTITLSCGICPRMLDCFVYDLDITKNDPPNFMIAVSIELTKRLHIAEASYRTVDFDGEMSTLPIPKREISTHLFHDWAISKGWELPVRFPKSLPNLKTVIQPLYPWGTHNTKLLMQLSEAAIKFWSNYDLTQPDTAPKNEEVSDWLINEGLSKTLAEAMATILRADGLRTGRR